MRKFHQWMVTLALMVFSVLPAVALQVGTVFAINVKVQTIGAYSVQGSCKAGKTTFSGGKWFFRKSDNTGGDVRVAIGMRWEKSGNDGIATIRFSDGDGDGDEDTVSVAGGWNKDGLVQPVKVTSYDMFDETVEATN
jgi:hypothetical protein